jgi:hypothetical protein
MQLPSRCHILLCKKKIDKKVISIFKTATQDLCRVCSNYFLLNSFGFFSSLKATCPIFQFFFTVVCCSVSMEVVEPYHRVSVLRLQDLSRRRRCPQARSRHVNTYLNTAAVYFWS